MRGWLTLRTRVRTLLVCVFLTMVVLASRSGFSTEGIFQGKVVNPPVDETVTPGWIFVQGRNHLLRRVEVIHAVIVFGQQVPLSQRRKCGPECLEEGQEIRVTAEQDHSGEWRARRVEILRLTSHSGAVAAKTGISGNVADFTKLNTALAGAPG